MPYDLIGSTSILEGVQDRVQFYEINKNTTEPKKKSKHMGGLFNF